MNQQIKQRKSQGLSLNFVIIGILALVVLVVVIIIFSSNLNLFRSDSKEISDTYTFCTCLYYNIPAGARPSFFCSKIDGEGFSLAEKRAISACMGIDVIRNNIDCGAVSLTGKTFVYSSFEDNIESCRK
ncbi:MAG TPA: hypothetical protein ENN46_02790 [Candidatus Woesearchaeota archaeon]|nr:hypothetical protein [Candidatus Woesearchaeota archaeon]